MRISIDASGLGAPKTGTAVYLSEILKAWRSNSSLTDEFFIIATERGRAHLGNLGEGEFFHFIAAPESRPLRLLWQQAVLPRLLRRHAIDVHWGAGFVLPLLSNVPAAVTIYDLTFQILPDVHERTKRLYFPAMIRASVGKAQQVITISRSAEADLLRLYPDTAGKTNVTLLAPRHIGTPRRPEKSNRPEPLRFLFVGTIEPRKNLARLLEAWRQIPDERRADAEVRVVGATGWMVRDLLIDAKALPGVKFLGPLSDHELVQEYKQADVFVYLSLYEGFGLPVIEAMSMGIPVLTSNTGATREVAGEAALLVDPSSVDSIRGGLLQLMTDAQLRQTLADKGRARAAEFSWEKTAAETLAVLHKCAAAAPR
jgi:glycosyltransferase involved in cell wall biosynthesis